MKSKMQCDNATINFIFTLTQKTLIGEGTYGKVYKISPKEVIKHILLDSNNGLPFTFLREIRVLKSFPHPNIITLNSVQLENSTFIMEFMSFDLASLINLNMNFTEELIVSIIYQVLKALKHLHKNNIIHRDIKPGNILLNKDGTVKLADFGLARNINDCMTNRVCTLWYRAPELLLGSENYNEKIDSYSLGLVILSMKNIFFKGNGEIEQVILIFNKFGMPLENYKWSKMFEVEKYKKNKNWYKIMFEEFGSVFNYDLMELVSELIRLEPKQRISCENALLLKVFENVKIKEINCGFDEMHEMNVSSVMHKGSHKSIKHE